MTLAPQQRALSALGVPVPNPGPPSSSQDLAAARGLLELEKRVHQVPSAVFEFLQAGGIPASITIIASKPVHPDLQAAAVSLLLAVVQKQPAAAYAAFRAANGMASLTQLLLLGARLSSGTPPNRDGAKLVAAASRLVVALLEVDVCISGQAFCQAGGLPALRACLLCAPSSEQGFVVAGEAVAVLASLTTGGPGQRLDAMIVFANAICVAHMARPLLAVIAAGPLTSAAVKALEVLRKLAASSNTNLRLLQQARCLEDMLALLRVAPLDSRVAKLAATLLRDFAEWDASTRHTIVQLGGVRTLLGVLRRAPASDVLTCHLVAGTLGLLAAADVDSSALSGKSLLHWAAQFGEVGAVVELVRGGGVAVNAKDGRGNTPLHLAALGGHLAAIRELLLSRADALQKNGEGRMPHHLAEAGTAPRRMLKSELSWRLCLEEPQACSVLPLGPDGAEESLWLSGGRCHFRPLTGEVVVEAEPDEASPGAKWGSRDWLKRVVSDVAGKVPSGRRRTSSDSVEVTPPGGGLSPSLHGPAPGPASPAHLAGSLRHCFVIPAGTRLREVDARTLLLDFIGRAGDGSAGRLPRGVTLEKLSIRIVAPRDLTAADLAMGVSFLRQRIHPDAAKEPELREAQCRTAAAGELVGVQVPRAAKQSPPAPAPLGEPAAAPSIFGAGDEAAAIGAGEEAAVSMPPQPSPSSIAAAAEAAAPAAEAASLDHASSAAADALSSTAPDEAASPEPEAPEASPAVDHVVRTEVQEQAEEPQQQQQQPGVLAAPESPPSSIAVGATAAPLAAAATADAEPQLAVEADAGAAALPASPPSVPAPAEAAPGHTATMGSLDGAQGGAAADQPLTSSEGATGDAGTPQPPARLAPALRRRTSASIEEEGPTAEIRGAGLLAEDAWVAGSVSQAGSARQRLGLPAGQQHGPLPGAAAGDAQAPAAAPVEDAWASGKVSQAGAARQRLGLPAVGGHHHPAPVPGGAGSPQQPAAPVEDAWASGAVSQANAARQRLGLPPIRPGGHTMAEKLAQVAGPPRGGAPGPAGAGPGQLDSDQVVDERGIDTDIPSFRELRARAAQLEGGAGGAGAGPGRPSLTRRPSSEGPSAPPAAPPPPPPPPRASQAAPHAAVDSSAASLAAKAADEMRRKQAALGRGLLYKPDVQRVTDKVKELEQQIGLVQQSRAGGLQADGSSSPLQGSSSGTMGDGATRDEEGGAAPADVSGPPTPEREARRAGSAHHSSLF